MKIVYLNPSAQLGGAEAALFTLLSSIRKRSPDWDLELVVTEQGPLISRIRALGISVKILPFPLHASKIGDSGAGGPAGSEVGLAGLFSRLAMSAPSLALYLLRLRKALRRASPDIIHSNGLKMHLLAALAKPAKVPLVWHIHDYVGARPLMSRLLRMTARSCTKAVTNSKSVAADLTKLCGRDLDVVTIYNAIDLERFAPDGPAVDLDSLSGLSVAPEGTVRIGLVATMAKWKGHAVFLRALAQLPADLPLRGYVVGGAVYPTLGSQSSMASLRQLAKELGLEGRVGFTGFIEDSPSLMRALDVVVHASTLPEPFGLVIAEAMASGRPVAVSSAGGAAEIAALCGTQLSYPPGDSAALAQILSRLITDRSLRESTGKDGRRCAELHFDRERFGKEFGAVYEEVVRSQEGRRKANGEW